VVGVVVVLFLAVSILLHELGHALACKAYGCEIRRGGFRLFFGFPAFFVDTTDIWLESRSVHYQGAIGTRVFFH
jgi:putative peptide zinc metalloprotease protein